MELRATRLFAKQISRQQNLISKKVCGRRILVRRVESLWHPPPPLASAESRRLWRLRVQTPNSPLDQSRVTTSHQTNLERANQVRTVKAISHVLLLCLSVCQNPEIKSGSQGQDNHRQNNLPCTWLLRNPVGHPSVQSALSVPTRCRCASQEDLLAIPIQARSVCALCREASHRSCAGPFQSCCVRSLCLWCVGLPAAAARQLLGVAVGQLAFETSVWGMHNQIDTTGTRPQSTQLVPVTLAKELP
jgi:hypothetical protein